jgi:hypothetical protein
MSEFINSPQLCKKRAEHYSQRPIAKNIKSAPPINSGSGNNALPVIVNLYYYTTLEYAKYCIFGDLMLLNILCYIKIRS